MKINPIKNNEQEKISLCFHCQCMTKTINGNCGKCGENKKDMKPIKNKESWIDKFDNLKIYYPNVRVTEPLLIGVEAEKVIKSFISTLLSKQKQEYKGQLKRIWYQKGYQEGKESQKQEIIGIIKKSGKLAPLGDFSQIPFCNGYNQAISDLIEKLKEMED